jgi:hypothetical protein
MSTTTISTVLLLSFQLSYHSHFNNTITVISTINYSHFKNTITSVLKFYYSHFNDTITVISTTLLLHLQQYDYPHLKNNTI